MRNTDFESRAVQGVRRWIGSQPSSNQNKLHGKSTSNLATQETSAEHTLDWYSTETIAKQLLDPVVSEVEKAEYQGSIFLSMGFHKCSSRLNRYIDQCQELLDAPATLGERKALEVYALAVQAARGDTHDYLQEEIPKEFFSYIERSSTQYLDGGKKEALPVSFDYDRWLRGG